MRFLSFLPHGLLVAASLLANSAIAQGNVGAANEAVAAKAAGRAKVIDDQLGAWELGTSFGKAVVAATVETNITAELRLDEAHKKARDMGLEMPALPRERRDKRGHVVFLRNEERGRVYRAIETRYGQAAANLYRWGMFVQSAKLGNVESIASVEAIEKSMNKVLAECQLPAALGQPISAVGKAYHYGKMDEAIERVDSRVKYLVTEVRAHGRPDSELNDPQIDSLIFDAAIRRQELALHQAFEAEASPAGQTKVLLQWLANPPTGYILNPIWKRLKEVGPRSLPTICSEIPRGAKLDESEWQTDRHLLMALDMVIFDQVVQLGDVRAHATRPFSSPCIKELARCVSAGEVLPAASLALQRASLATNGRATVELLTIGVNARDEKWDQVLTAIALAHILNGFRQIDRFAARGELTSDPREAYETDLEAVRKLTIHAREAIVSAESALMSDSERRRNAELAMRWKRDFLDEIRHSLGDLNPRRVEQRQALKVWERALRQAMAHDDNKNLENKFAIYDAQIEFLEKRLGRSVTRRHSAPGPLGTFVIELNESVMRAGRFAEESEIIKDLQSAIRARDERFADYVSAIDQAAFQSLTAAEQSLVTKHSLRRASLDRAEQPSDK